MTLFPLCKLSLESFSKRISEWRRLSQIIIRKKEKNLSRYTIVNLTKPSLLPEPCIFALINGSPAAEHAAACIVQVQRSSHGELWSLSASHAHPCPLRSLGHLLRAAADTVRVVRKICFHEVIGN